MATAQQLLDLSTDLTDAASAITDYIAAQPDSDDPSDDRLTRLGDVSVQIAVQANAIERTAIEALAGDVGSAIDGLAFQIGQAENAMKRIGEAQRILDVASAVLAAAASVATSVGTGNWIGAASAVVELAKSIHNTLAPPQPAAADDGSA